MLEIDPRFQRVVAVVERCLRSFPILLEQPGLSRLQTTGHGQAHMVEGAGGEDAATGGALDEALLDEVGFDDVLDGVTGFGERRGDGLDADRDRRRSFRR